MLLNVSGSRIVGFTHISSPEVEAAQALATGAIQVPDFDFTEPLDCYEYTDGEAQLKKDWEAIKAGLEAEAEGQIQNEQGDYIPQKLSRAQARGALILVGLIDQVQTAIDTIEDPLQRALLQNDWDNRQDFQRDYPQLLTIATALGLTDEQIDQLFIEGAKL